MKRPSHDQRGYHCLATNAISNTSEVGQSIAKRSGTFILTFFIKGDEAICSLHAPFDVSVIATHYGGGRARASEWLYSPDQMFLQ
jgi:hypothetical protein